jgi:flavin-dependent dehydrogenase
MNTTLNQLHEYDVVIMGAGFAGVCQARHLLLTIPGIKVAIVDPRSPERLEEKDLKIGESLIEIAAVFLCKELGLHDYLIEHHTPKSGLNFHWSKDPASTQHLEDYYHVWANRQTPISSFHIHRARFEQDVLRMNKDMGAVFYHGRVVETDLTPGDAVKNVRVKRGDEEVTLRAKHVIDAAGRKFLIGRKTDNLLFGAENLLGLDQGAAWLRVKNVDRTLFQEGYTPANTASSPYYATNHFFGHGHWLWMIPIDRQSMELSIGMVHHHRVIPSETINSLAQFQAFLAANHTVLARLIESGEIVDFHYWSKLAHRSKVLFSPDNWYVIGDAAHIFDAFYSYGTTMIALSIESVTEIIRAKLADAPDAEQKRAAYNEFNLAYARSVNCLYRGHDRQLGHASIMSWRIYFEYMWWFGVHIPMYIGKWHLDLKFIPRYVAIANSNVDGLFADLCEQFNQLVDRDINLGLMDCYRADQLVNGYTPLKHFDSFLENTKFEPRRCNVFASMKQAYFYIAIWYVTFQWKGFGLAGLLAPRNLSHIGRLLMLSGKAAIAELIYKFKTRNLPNSSHIQTMRQEFKCYSMVDRRC